jgi:hypothetical protein
MPLTRFRDRDPQDLLPLKPIELLCSPCSAPASVTHGLRQDIVAHTRGASRSRRQPYRHIRKLQSEGPSKRLNRGPFRATPTNAASTTPCSRSADAFAAEVVRLAR